MKSQRTDLPRMSSCTFVAPVIDDESVLAVFVSGFAGASEKALRTLHSRLACIQILICDQSISNHLYLRNSLRVKRHQTCTISSKKARNGRTFWRLFAKIITGSVQNLPLCHASDESSFHRKASIRRLTWRDAKWRKVKRNIFRIK